MRAGKLRHRIEVDEPITSQNDTGEEIVNFMPWPRKVSAEVHPLTGRERLLSNGILASFDTRIEVRWSPENARIDAKWRILFAGIIYNIVSAEDVDFAHRRIEIMATSGANEG